MKLKAIIVLILLFRSISFGQPIGHLLPRKTGGTATFTVAASDSTAYERMRADYLCDGTADEVQIQAAIDAIYDFWGGGNGGKGGIVVLTPGSYTCADAIRIKNRVSLQGMAGIQGTYLTWANGTNCNGIDFTANENTRGDFELKNMTLVNENDGTYWVIDINGVSTWSVKDCVFEQLYISGGGNSSDQTGGGMHVQKGWANKYIGCLFEHSRGKGAFLDDASGSYLTNCYFAHNDSYGLHIEGGAIKIINCAADDCGEENDYSAFYVRNADYAILSNCIVTDTNGPGFLIATSDYTSLVNCYVTGANKGNNGWFAGFEIGSTGTEAGNRLIGCTAADCNYGNQGQGFYLKSPNTELIACRSEDNYYGLNTTANADDCYYDIKFSNSDSTDFILNAGAERPLFALRTYQSTITAATENIEYFNNGGVYIADCSSNLVTMNLPKALVGLEFTFLVSDATNELRLEPDGSDYLKLANGNKTSAGGDYLTNNTAKAADDGCRLRCVIAGVWEHYDSRGTWTEQ